jgi:ribosome maturation factor RimP
MPEPGASRARLVQLLTPAVQATGLDLEDVTVSPAGRRKVVRVVVDVQEGAGGNVSLDDIAGVSRVVSELLDAPEGEELLAGSYTLEVTSPGVDRPLTEARHWRRNVGRLVKAHLGDGSSVTGRVQ